MSHSNISPIVTEVLEFGRTPVQKKNPRTEEEREENMLAIRLSKKKKSLTDLDRLQLAALTERRERKQPQVESLLNEVRQLGYYPKETRANPVECSLAMRLRRALQHKCFNQAQLEELQQLREQSVHPREAARSMELLQAAEEPPDPMEGFADVAESSSKAVHLKRSLQPWTSSSSSSLDLNA